MSGTQVPILITWDVDPDRWTSLERRKHAFSMAADLCEKFGIHVTFFVTAKFANEYRENIDRVQDLGSEVGCHGWTHADEEDYDSMSLALQRAYIEEATRGLEIVTHKTVHSFRSPRVKTSSDTLRILAECGYQVDSSVCSQRIDFVRLYVESRRTGKPIVYLAHPTEFLIIGKWKPAGLKELSLQHIRTHGFLVRNMLYRLAGEALFSATHKLFAYMASFPDVNFMTCSDYASALGDVKRFIAA